LYRLVPDIVLILGAGVVFAALVAGVFGRRGGRFRALPGWALFWAGFAAVLVVLSRGPRWLAFVVLALLMLGSLRAYFFVAPVRAKDRWAILAAYAAVPLALWPAVFGPTERFLALVPFGLLLVLPALLSAGSVHEGLLDATGRVLIGALCFVYCTAHLGLLIHEPTGRLELFGCLALTVELVQRVVGRPRPGSGTAAPLSGFLVGALLAIAAGWWLSSMAALRPKSGAILGLLVAMAVTAGSWVMEAIASEFKLAPGSARFGRGAFLDRMVSAVYAAPVFYHALPFLK